MSAINAGDVLWTPSDEAIEASATTALMREVGAADYEELWHWSVEDVGRFWATIWERFDVQADGDPSVALARRRDAGRAGGSRTSRSPFPSTSSAAGTTAAVAIRFASEDQARSEWTWGDLREQTTRIRAGLQRWASSRGDRVVGYLPNVPADRSPRSSPPRRSARRGRAARRTSAPAR